MLRPGLICHSDKITAVFRRKNPNIFAASGFHKIPRIIYCACALTTVTGKLPVYTMCSQFKHYVVLVNLPHSSSCPMFPYAPGQLPPVTPENSDVPSATGAASAQQEIHWCAEVA